MDDKIVLFDNEGMLRIFDPEQFDEAEDLQRQAQSYVEKLNDFRSEVEKQMSVIKTQGDRIEKAKLAAIGARNKVDGEADARRTRQREIGQQVKEKQIEMDRYLAEYNSLQKVEADQKSFMDELSSAGGE